VQSTHFQPHRIIEREHRADLHQRGLPDRLLEQIDLADLRSGGHEQSGHPPPDIDDLHDESGGPIGSRQAIHHLRQRNGTCGGEVDVARRPVDQVMRAERMAPGQHETEIVTGVEPNLQQPPMKLIHAGCPSARRCQVGQALLP
jgi:hypothetical protein